MKKLFVLSISLSMFAQVFSQDSIKLSYSEFISIVKKYHPLAYNFQIQNKIAENDVMNAKGNFDPILSSKIGEKEIGNTTYYNQQNIELTIPTWYGIELNAGYNNYEGERLNNNDTKGEVYQFGITIPLAKNLIIDKRRAILQQQKFFQKMTFAEQQLKTNELLSEAENAFWSWIASYEVYKLHSEVVENNKKRLQFTTKSYNFGERPAIDTVEVKTQLQNFELLKQDSYLAFLKNTQEIYTYLWKENSVPYDVYQVIFPSEKITDNNYIANAQFLIQQIKDKNIASHAALIYYNEKQNILETEKKLKWQSFLPKVDFSYNFFESKSYQSEYLPPFENNFQYGIKLEIPIFLRQARADYENAKLKIEQNTQDITWKTQDLRTKIMQYSNEVESYDEQINIANQNLSNYKKLLNAEEIRYSNGESSLFLINSRESKLIEFQEKIIYLHLKYFKSYTILKWLNEGFSGP